MNDQSQMYSAQIAQLSNHPHLMMNRSYKPWAQDPNPNPNLKFSSLNPNYAKSNIRSNNWKGKKVPPSLDNRRMEKFEKPLMMAGGGGSTLGFVNDLQYQNRLNPRKFYSNKKKLNNNSRFAPYAPRNTSSFIIRAKKSGGIASLVSPCPVTPAVLPTPVFSPSSEVLGDMAKEEWGVDGYGSMKGLIRLRSPGSDDSEVEDEDGGNGGGSSESDLEEHVEVERRLDHDLSRFEMIYPSYGGGNDYNNVLENRVDDQNTHIAQLEEENLMLKERLLLMERELGDLSSRLLFLERHTQVVENVNEEVVENSSDNENESDGGGSDIRMAGCVDNAGIVEFVAANEAVENRRNADFGLMKSEGTKDVCMKDIELEEFTLKSDEKKSEQRSHCELKVEAVDCNVLHRQVVEEKEDRTKAERFSGN